MPEFDDLMPEASKTFLFMRLAKKRPQRRCDETPQASEGFVSKRKGTYLRRHLQT